MTHARDPVAAKILLNRLKWKTVEQSFKEMSTICVDCYLFRFEPPLNEHDQYAFLEYMEALDLTLEASIIKMAIWLYQHDIPFHLVFRYNRACPFLYNLLKIRRPKQISKNLEAHKDQLMECDLSTLP